MQRTTSFPSPWIIVALAVALTLGGCAAGPETQPTYLAVERGLRWQCQDAREPAVCVQQKYLALQERHRRVLAQNECAVARGWRTREHDNAACRAAPAPQRITCRRLPGVLTCTLDDDASPGSDSAAVVPGSAR